MKTAHDRARRLRATAPHRSSRSAFTIVEILVASSIMVILIGVVLTMTGGVLNSWNRSAGVLGRNSAATSVFEVLAQDLEAAFFKDDGAAWLVATLGNAGEGAEVPSTFLRFFTVAPDRDRGTESAPKFGDLTAVAYQIKLLNPINPSNDDNRTYALYRSIKTGEETFENFLGELENKGEEDFFDVSSEATISNSYLAGNVVGLKIIWGYRTKSGGTTETESGGTTETEPDQAEVRFPGSGDLASVKQPEYADITLTVISEEGAQRLRAAELGLVTELPKDIILRNSTAFTRRVRFLNRAL